MPQTSRERVTRCLKFETPDRLPRELWALPWASAKHPDTVRLLNERFPGDFGNSCDVYRPSPRRTGDAYAVGEATDDWGCRFVNIHAGVIGEVRDPSLRDIADWKSVRPPYETLPDDPARAREAVKRYCAGTDLFVRAGCCPRPWERYQFLRGTEEALCDMCDPDAGARDLLREIHRFYLQEIEFWVSTAVDGIFFMDDWGSQQQLLIPPAVWRDLFKPLYRDYCQLAHARGKFAFMHSDGCIREIYPDLVEVGVDALNSQIFCMDMAELARIAKGRMTFWGEIDRQHVLTSPDPQAGRAAVRQAARHLYDPKGGIIAQFEFGPGGNPETALAVFDEWNRVDAEGRSGAAAPA